jgi:hypothetical protein
VEGLVDYFFAGECRRDFNKLFDEVGCCLGADFDFFRGLFFGGIILLGGDIILSRFGLKKF